MHTVDIVNTKLAFQASMVIGLVAIYSLFTFFTICKMLFDASFEFNKTVSFNILWCIYLNTYVLSIMLGSSLLSNEKQKALRYLRILVGRTKNQLHLAKLMALCSQIQKQQTTITSGLFDFDWKLVLSVNKPFKSSFKYS